MFQSLTLLAAITAAAMATPAMAQNTAPPSELHPPINLDADTLRARFAPSTLGLKPNTSKTAPASGLPFGLDYNREVKSLMVPLDEKNEWGVGVGLNMNQSKIIELSPGSVLGLQQPNRTPGLTLHKKF
jgi:hypothetical protein